MFSLVVMRGESILCDACDISCRLVSVANVGREGQSTGFAVTSQIKANRIN